MLSCYQKVVPHKFTPTLLASLSSSFVLGSLLFDEPPYTCLRVAASAKADEALTYGGVIFLEGDGLAGGGGLAFNFFLDARINITDNLSGKAGYRILEDGTDVSSVYNFTLFNFAVAGIAWEF